MSSEARAVDWEGLLTRLGGTFFDGPHDDNEARGKMSRGAEGSDGCDGSGQP